MKTIVRNFTTIFRKFFTANVLNLIGLSLAFASFFVIMTQVNYDLSYNKSITEHENLYRVTLDLGPGNETYGNTLSRPVIERLGVASPHITDYGIYSGTFFDQYQVGENEFTLFVEHGIKDFLGVFKPTMIAGSTEGLNLQNNIALPKSEAIRMFGTSDVVGQTLKYKWNENIIYNICGVFEDYPENNFLHGHCFIGDDYSEGNFNNWNFQAYIRLDDNKNKSEVLDVIRNTLIDLFKEQYNMNSKEDEENFKVIFTSIADTHFSKTLDKAAPDKSSSYLLLCFSLLIVVIAAVNFMNFSLAETPMRIRSINTQKVLGATAAKLRASLLVEALIISLIAFVVAMLIVYLAHDFGLQELVQASIRLQDHTTLLVITMMLSIAVGLLAGAYPSYYVTSFPPALVLKGSFGLSPKGRVLRTILICLQFVVSFVLVIGVGIMYLQSYFIYNSDYGFDQDEVLVVTATPATREKIDVVNTELRKISGIEGASLSQFTFGMRDRFNIMGMGQGERHLEFTCFCVDWRFLDVMGIDIVEGRNFRESDGDVCVFNESAKKQYPWLTVNQPITDGEFPVVGFCNDVKYSTLRVDDSELPIAFLVPSPYGEFWHQGFWRNHLMVRVSKGVDKREIKQKVLDVVNKIETEFTLDISNLQYMDEGLEKTYEQENLFTKQILLFSLLAILISIIGVFGLTMFESEYRRKEIGIRKVFGSSTTEILKMFNKRYLYILLGCFVVAAPVGYLLGVHWLEGFAVRTAISPLLFLVSFLLVTLITMLTVTYQSWKNANENPVNSIKTE